MPLADRLVALAIVAVWGFNFVVIKWGVAGVPPFLLGALRFAVAAAVGLWLVRRPQIAWRDLAVYGLTVGFGQFAFLFSAIKAGMPASLASIVLQSQAFFTLLLGFAWLGERFGRAQLAGLATGSAGLFLIGLSSGNSLPATGFGLTVAAALCWAVSNLVVRRIVRRGGSPDMLALVVYSSLVPIVPFLLMWALFEQPATDWSAVLTLKSAAAVGYLALVATLFGYSQWSRLLSRHSANVVAPYSLLVPFFGVLSASLFLGETLDGLQVLGGILLVAGLATGSPVIRRLFWRGQKA
ncbi:EamA family transporter [Laribacter hongkongensis]|uniref:EamA family transporter n=1 Tax=Laribacter hongkongensis TaxID=168471 RepID=UPI001EFCBDE4|nr:EamA family transporter [Laribacter hongkongensis]MCG9076612.1 EamA family transporter [Laribacter hongkongensis]